MASESYTMLKDHSEDDSGKTGYPSVLPHPDSETLETDEEREKPRNLIAFWIFGLCNNFAYVVMLSAAFDILSTQQGKEKHTEKKGFHCNAASTGVILLADVLPTLILKLIAPYFMQSLNYHIRVAIVVLAAITSFIMVALSPSVAVSVVGVVFASISSGFGEVTFLSLSSHFKKSTISTWSSGTGAAGVAGALAYAGLTSAGLSPRNSVLVMLTVPILHAFAFWVLLEMPRSIRLSRVDSTEAMTPILGNTGQDLTRNMTLKQKLELVTPLMKYMIPLFLVYLAEYTINQGLFELLYYDISWLTQAEQYRWFQVDYQIGVFISRSSASLFRIHYIAIPTVLQYFVFIILLLEVIYTYIPIIWLTLLVVLFEGFCGGAVYVNAFYNISEDVPPEFREFSMGAASVADSCGITIAGLIAVPIHTALCKLKLS